MNIVLDGDTDSHGKHTYEEMTWVFPTDWLTYSNTACCQITITLAYLATYTIWRYDNDIFTVRSKSDTVSLIYRTVP